MQRVHNAKSLIPLIQVDVLDRQLEIAVRIRNNGIGPFILKKVTFIKDGQSYLELEDCLNLDPRSYQHFAASETVDTVIQAGQFDSIFSTEFMPEDTEAVIENVRAQLSTLEVKIDGMDVYNNKIAVQKNLHWFRRKQSLPS